MTALTRPRHRLVERALADARRWCAGQTIDERPALVHAVRVAATIGAHVEHPPPRLVAAALLHDAPELAPPDLDLDTYLRTRYGPEVPRVVYALQAEHLALDTPHPPVTTHDPPVLLAATADRIVAFESLLRRAQAPGGDPATFLAARPALVRLLPHFRACHTACAGLVPSTMSTRLGRLLDRLDRLSATGHPLAAEPPS